MAGLLVCAEPRGFLDYLFLVGAAAIRGVLSSLPAIGLSPLYRHPSGSTIALWLLIPRETKAKGGLVAAQGRIASKLRSKKVQREESHGTVFVSRLVLLEQTEV